MKSETKKVTKKMVSIPGQKERIPVYFCPPGMSGSGIELERHFNTNNKDEVEFETSGDSTALDDTLKENLGFKLSYQRYRDEGEVSNPELEDFLYQKQATKYYDEKYDRQAELTSIFKD